MDSDLYPCAEPVCDHNGKGCVNGICKSPNLCACDIGWEGLNCDKCIKLPGCKNGFCENELECQCEENWSGGFCQIRKYVLI